jgi:hypothetical protein
MEWVSLLPRTATMSVPSYAPALIFFGSTSPIATLRVVPGRRRPPVVSLAKVTLWMNGEISPRTLKETCSWVGECDVTRKTSHQLLQLEGETSPKSSESEPWALAEAIGKDRLQPASDACIAREQPGLKLMERPQPPVEMVTGEAAGFVTHQAFAPMATARNSINAAARTLATLAMAGRRRALAAAGTMGSSDGAAGTLRDPTSVASEGSRVDWPKRAWGLPPTCPW